MILVTKLQSRKFILTCAVLAFFAFQHQFDAMVTTTLAYLAVQGGVDAYTKGKAELPPE